MSAPAQNGGRARIALLIDAENIPAAFATALVDDAAGHGDVTVRRAYGDFHGEVLRGWAEACPRLAIRAQQVFQGGKGRNSADLALAIDAIDLLHRDGIQGFCLASSDGDFSHLALRLREYGVTVIGYGERKAPECFRQACSRFIDLVPPPPVLVVTKPEVAKAPVTKPLPAKSAPVKPAPAKPIMAKSSVAKAQVAKPGAAKPSVAAARGLLLKAHGQCGKDAEGWVNGSLLRNEVGKIQQGFALATYGHGTFRKFIAWTDGFDIRDDGTMLVRPRGVGG